MVVMNTSIASEHSVPIWSSVPPGYKPELGQPVPTVTPYLVKTNPAKGGVVVLPGGGYGGKASHESEPIARWLNSLGISAFILDYRVAPYRHPYPLLDAKRAIRFVRSKAAEWLLNPAHIGILGFSAGGHLASTTGIHLETFDEEGVDAVSSYSARPDTMILCYPVITFSVFRHSGSMENLLGSNPPEALRDALSSEKQVTADTPPAFIWHTANDEIVPVENSLLFANALSVNRVPYEMHIFPDGAHGLGLAVDYPQVSQWTTLCALWFRHIGFLE